MSDSHEVETRLRETARELLRDKKVSLFLGYEKASIPFRTTPLFLTGTEELDRLAWNPFCAANLSVYLPRLFRDARAPRNPPPPPTVGVLVKGCDSRSVAALLQERQIPRENLVLVGIPCPGVVDARKAERALHGHEALGAGEDARGNIRAVVDDGTELTLRREEVLADACLECSSPTPAIHDIMLGKPLEGRKTDRARQRVAEFEARALEERWTRFRDAFSKCIRCNACREACPMCYCTTCLMEQSQPRWIAAGSDFADVAMYHLVRALHMAGRCTECGACERACPMGIDVRLLGRKMSLEVEDLFGYRAGEAVDGSPVMSCFAMDDPQDFVTEP